MKVLLGLRTATHRIHLLICAVLLAAIPVAKAQTETLLYSFGTDAEGPFAGVIMDKSGNLYGTTPNNVNGPSYGTVYQLSPSGVETILYKFAGCPNTGCPGDGVAPYVVTLITDKAGNFYGTTAYGGAYGYGTVWKLASGVESVLYSFASYDANNANTGGAVPYSGVIMDSSGNLYGTTLVGGPSGLGVVYKLTSSGIEVVLHSFSGPQSGGQGADGAEPVAPLLMDKAGNLYGTTQYGGTYGLGTVFKVTPTGSYSIVYDFSGSPLDGAEPYAGPMVMDKMGNLYGTTAYGGSYNWGTVFELSPSGAESLLYSFTNSNGDGAVPYAGLLLDGHGNFYGSTYQGGDSTQCGTAWRLTPSGVETVLHMFTGYPGDGCHPYSGALIVDSKGRNLYGTTLTGGSYNSGTVFSVTTR